MTEEELRCQVCGWPLSKSRKEGCVMGECAYRPRPGSAEHERIEIRRLRVERDEARDALTALRQRIGRERKQEEEDGSLISDLRTRVEALVRELHRKRDVSFALRSLKRGDCWCEKGIGNPMVTTHTAECELARKVLDG